MTRSGCTAATRKMSDLFTFHRHGVSYSQPDSLWLQMYHSCPSSSSAVRFSPSSLLVPTTALRITLGLAR